MKTFLLTLMLLCSPFLFGQNSEYTSVYFDSDVHSLREIEKKAITQFIQGIDRIQSIQLEGHADASGYKDKNESLSKNRVLAVRKKLLELGIPDSLISDQYYGDNNPQQSNESTKGRQANRRVDILVQYKLLMPQLEDPIIVKMKNCTDTTILFPQGTAVVINRCVYDSIKDQFNLTEFNTGESLRNSNLTTMTTDGKPLITGGMFKLDIPDDTPVTILVPLNPYCGQTRQMTLWNEQHDQWSQSQDSIETVLIDGKKYSQIKTTRSSYLNCDFLALNPPTTKVVLRNGLKVNSAKLSWDSPPTVLLGKTKRIRKNVSVFLVGCPCSPPMIAVNATDRKGNSYSMDYTPLTSFKAKEADIPGRCENGNTIKRILFFRIQEKSIYRKYIIKKKDFKKVNG